MRDTRARESRNKVGVVEAAPESIFILKGQVTDSAHSTVMEPMKLGI